MQHCRSLQQPAAVENDGPWTWSRGYNPHFSRTAAKMAPRHLQFVQRAWLRERFTPCRRTKFICEQISRIMPFAAAGLMIKSSTALPRYSRILSIALIIARHIWRYALSVFIVRRLTAAGGSQLRAVSVCNRAIFIVTGLQAAHNHTWRDIVFNYACRLSRYANCDFH